MVQNKIYLNYFKEIVKTFLVILFALSIIAWTVRAVSFLDLIVENGYSISTYFQYSMLNLIGILTKFIPLAFLIALVIFILKQIHENEFIILWTSGVKKIKLANLFFFISIVVLFFYLVFSTLITPYALNKSRHILSKDGFNSFLPTIRIQQFSDSFKGFTFFVGDKIDNKIKNVFIHDKSNKLKTLSANQSSNSSTTIVAQRGVVLEKKMILFKGQVITSEKDSLKSNIIKFEQLNIDLKNLETDTIKVPKLQETSTLTLLTCFDNKSFKTSFCEQKTKKEIITVLNRRIVLPFYIPIVALLSSLLLIKSNLKKNYLFNKYSVFAFGFLTLLFAELVIRYTGISKIVNLIFIISPIVLIILIYFFLMFMFARESISR